MLPGCASTISRALIQLARNEWHPWIRPRLPIRIDCRTFGRFLINQRVGPQCRPRRSRREKFIPSSPTPLPGRNCCRGFKGASSRRENLTVQLLEAQSRYFASLNELSAPASARLDPAAAGSAPRPGPRGRSSLAFTT